MNVTMATKRRAYTLIGQKVLHRALIFAFGRASWMEKKEWTQYLLDITLVSCSGKEGENQTLRKLHFYDLYFPFQFRI